MSTTKIPPPLQMPEPPPRGPLPPDPAPAGRDASETRFLLGHRFARIYAHLITDWYGGNRGGSDTAEILCVAPTTAGFVIHVGNSGPSRDSDGHRVTERHDGGWIAYDTTPSD